MLRQRVMTAVVGLAVLSAALFSRQPFVFFLLCLVFFLSCVHELCRAYVSQSRYTVTVAGVKVEFTIFTVFFAALSYALFTVTTPIFFVIFYLFVFAAVLILSDDHKSFYKTVSFLSFLSLYILVPWVLIFDLNRDGNQLGELFYLLGTVWVSDTGAYFAGKNLGKRKLVPDISPKKTVAGAVGGCAAAILFSLCYGLFVLDFEFETVFFKGLVAVDSFSQSLFAKGVFFGGLGLVVSGASQIGDLFESRLKRFLGVKDSGNILPGHGGVLDRVDGLLFAVPIVWLCLKTW